MHPPAPRAKHRVATTTSQEDSDYLRALGARVRGLRKAQGLSRRELSQKSGLSPRFIAQLEMGVGNISVLRLKRLSAALGSNIPSIASHGVSSVPMPLEDDLARRVQLATPAQRARIAALLSDGNAGRFESEKARRIALIGLRGAGKSTLGRAAAGRLGLEFVELNTEIERQNGLRVSEIFSLYGDDGYRRLERDQLLAIAGRANLILAVAGGIVDSAEAYAFLRQNFVTVWLQARPDEHMARVIAQGDNRPMAGNPDAMKDLQRILAARRGHYALADLVFDTSGAPVAESTVKLTRLLAAELNLAAPEATPSEPGQAG